MHVELVAARRVRLDPEAAARGEHPLVERGHQLPRSEHENNDDGRANPTRVTTALLAAAE